MKKHFLNIALGISLLASTSAFAQENPNRNVVKFSPVHLIFQTLQVGYERFNPTQTNSNFVNTSLFLGNNSSDFAFTLGYQYRIYPKKMSFLNNNFGGVFIAPDIKVGYSELTFVKNEYITNPNNPNGYTYVENKSIQKYASYFPGFVFGFQRSYFTNLFVEATLGAGALFNSKILDTETYGYTQSDYFFDGMRGIYPKAGIAVGLSF